MQRPAKSGCAVTLCGAARARFRLQRVQSLGLKPYAMGLKFKIGLRFRLEGPRFCALGLGMLWGLKLEDSPYRLPGFAITRDFSGWVGYTKVN